MDKQTRNKLSSIMTERRDTQIYAFLGNLRTSEVEVEDRPSYVYATVAFNGQILKVKNNKVPNRLRLPIVIGYPRGSHLLQVVSIWDVYPNFDVPEVPHHPHLWGESDNPAWIRKEQIMELLPTSLGDMTVRVNAGTYSIDGIFRTIATAIYDLSSYVPAGSEAKWVAVSADIDRNITYTEGASVDTRFLLTNENLPTLPVENALLFACKVYGGQEIIMQNLYDTDIFDPRFILAAPLPSEFPPSPGSPYYAIPMQGLYRWTGDGSTTTFELVDILEELSSVHDNSLLVDPLEVALSSDGTQVVFGTAPTAGHVVVADGIVRTA